MTTTLSTRQSLPLRKNPWVRLRTGITRERSMIPAQLRETIRRLIKGESPWPLLLFGSVGTGKTCAALALCDMAFSAAFLSLEEAADGVVRRTLEREWIIERQLFCVDEIGERSNTPDLHYSALKRILDARTECGDVGIYISNLKPSDLQAAFDDRIASRLTRGTVLKVAGNDMRRIR